MKSHGECVFASEIDEKAQQTYKLNHEENYQFAGDITKVTPADIPDHDVLCGGFPCQSFSIAGHRKGFAETRGTLFFNIAQILEAKRPRAFILENVRGLLNHGDGRTMATIMETLKELGYHAKYQVLNATTHGNTPQNRERVYIVGFLDGKHADSFMFPCAIPLTNKVFGDVVDVADKKPDSFYQVNMEQSAVRMMHEHMTRQGVVYQARRKYIRANKKGVCPTLTANMGSGGHNVPLIIDNYGIRKLTPMECFTLQGFPEDFKIPTLANCHLYKQAGNSIPISVVSRIADNIAQTLKGVTHE